MERLEMPMMIIFPAPRAQTGPKPLLLKLLPFSQISQALPSGFLACHSNQLGYFPIINLTIYLFYTSLSTILILSGIVIAQRAVIIFRFAAKGSIPNDAIDTVLVFNLLKHMPLLLSLTVFITILMTLSRWYKDSEMIIWFSSGLGLYSLVRPVVTFCIPIIILIASLSLFISPWAVQKAEEYKSGLKNRDEIATITPGTFKESKSSNKLFYVEGFNSIGNSVKNIFIHKI